MNRGMIRKGSLHHWRSRFQELPAAVPEVQSFKSAFAGPTWLLFLAPPGLALLGMPRWCGKRFLDHGEGINLLKGIRSIRPAYPFHWKEASSAIDQKPCLQITYMPDARWPWPHVVDELRVLDERTWLGMTYVKGPSWMQLPLPFLLYNPEPLHEPHGRRERMNK